MKLGLIVEGGGMKCSYSAGVLDVFLDENINFDYTMGVSAGAANVASFLGRQKNRNRRFYCIHSRDPRYIGIKSLLHTGNLFGLDYIYSDLTNETGMDPLDFDEVMKNPAEMVFPATNAITGKVRYFTKSDMHKNDYTAIKATCALPVLAKPISIDGQLYYDGGVGDSIPIKKAFADGCDKVVIILSKPKGYRMKPQGHRFFYTMWLHKFPRTIWNLNHRHEKYNRTMEFVEKMEKEGKVFLFNPSGDIKMSTYTTDPMTMEKLYGNGIKDGRERLAALKEFLNEKEK